jgi:polyhydroxybutyrate depolymerase
MTNKGIAMTARPILKRCSIDVDGITRTYYIHVPPAFDGASPLPLVLAFHGGGGKATMMHRVSKLTNTSDEHSFIVVYPDGLEKQWGDRRAMTGFDRKGDLNFIRVLLNELERDYNVDPQRIYSTGISNGGFFSQDLAIAFPERIAAVASVAASVSLPVFNKVMPPQPVPILFILGDKDPIVPYAGGVVMLGSEQRGNVVSAEESVTYWCKANHCTKAGAPERIENPNVDDGTIAIRQSFDGDGQRNQVLLYTIEGGGHTWPSGWQYLGESFIGKTSRVINTNEVIWSFFQQHHI